MMEPTKNGYVIAYKFWPLCDQKTLEKKFGEYFKSMETMTGFKFGLIHQIIAKLPPDLLPAIYATRFGIWLAFYSQIQDYLNKSLWIKPWKGIWSSDNHKNT